MSLRKAISLNAVASKETHLIRREARRQRKKRKASDPLNFELTRPKTSTIASTYSHQHQHQHQLKILIERDASDHNHHLEESSPEEEDYQTNTNSKESQEGQNDDGEERRSSFTLPVIYEEIKESSKSLPTLHKTNNPLVDSIMGTSTKTRTTPTPSTINTSRTTEGHAACTHTIRGNSKDGSSSTATLSSTLQPSQIHNHHSQQYTIIVNGNNSNIIHHDDHDISPHLPDHLCGDIKHSITQLSHIKPLEFISSVFKRYNISSSYQNCTSLSTKNFFQPLTASNLNAYQADAIQAIRRKDVESLRRMQKSGRYLQGSNRFGESFMHIACRRGSTEVLEFLLQEAKCSLRVHDDYGRTPLHGKSFLHT